MTRGLSEYINNIILWKSNRSGFKLNNKHPGIPSKPKAEFRFPIASTLDDGGILP
jgi:hypothetical protein